MTFDLEVKSQAEVGQADNEGGHAKEREQQEQSSESKVAKSRLELDWNKHS